MYFSYLIDNDIFPNDTDRDIKLKAKAIGKLFKSIEFRSAWYDCSNMGMYNKVAERFLLYKNSKTIPGRTKTRFMELWKNYLCEKAIDLKSTNCQCSYPDCKINDNCSSISSLNKYIPHFVISEKNENHFLTLNINNYENDTIYQNMILNTAWKDQIPYDNNKAKDIFHNGFIAALSNNVQKVIIYDRNIWPYWGDDIKKGLLLFIELIELCGIKNLTIITGYRKKHSLTENTKDYDIKRYITDFLKNEIPDRIAVDIIVSESIQHYRFMKIEGLLCIDLDNGVSSFNPPKSVTETKRFKVDYKPVNEYSSELSEAKNNMLDDFSLSTP